MSSPIEETQDSNVVNCDEDNTSEIEDISVNDEGPVDTDSNNTPIDPNDTQAASEASNEQSLVSDEANSTENAPLVVDSVCQAAKTCVANSGDHRKVVSHVFGRNKACTRAIPHDAWIFWCRKHYQRIKYRAEEAGNWHEQQLELVKKQLDVFELRNVAVSWNVELRKQEQRRLDDENAVIAAKIVAGLSTTTVPGKTAPSVAAPVLSVTAPVQSAPNPVQSAAAPVPSAAAPVSSGRSSEDIATPKNLSTGAQTHAAGTPYNTPVGQVTRTPNHMTDPTTRLISGAVHALFNTPPTSLTSTVVTSRAVSTQGDHSPDTAGPSTAPGPSKTTKTGKATAKITKKTSGKTTSANAPDDDKDASTNDSEPEAATSAPKGKKPKKVKKTYPVWERPLIPHFGPNKSFDEVRAIIELIETEFKENEHFKGRDNEDKDFAGVEFLPNFAGDEDKKKKKAVKTTVKGAGGAGTKRKAGDVVGSSKRRQTLRSAGQS